MNAMMMAETLLKLGRKAEAGQWLEKASTIPDATEEDIQCSARIEVLRRQL